MCSDLRRLTFALAVAVSVTGCGSDRVAHPKFPGGGLLAQSTPVAPDALMRISGLFVPDGFARAFGPRLVVHPTDKTLSLFGGDNDAVVVLRPGCLDGGTRLVFEGTWRYLNETSTGLARLFLLPAEFAQKVCANDPSGEPGAFPDARLEGQMGNLDTADMPTTVRYEKPLLPMEDFVVGAHRGGCRTIDDIGASENSVECIRMAESFGASAIEVDVNRTSDGVPVLYHDSTFSARLTKGAYCVGNVADLTLAHIRANCQLRYGEALPTLEEALTTMLEETRLRGVWFDTKTEDVVPAEDELARQFNQRAQEMGRQFTAVIGIPSQKILDAYLKLDPANRAPCLTELELDDAIDAGCKLWAPNVMLGPARETVERAQENGIASVFWTVDRPEFMDLLWNESDPSGFLTNRAGLVLNRYQIMRGGS